MDEIKETEEVPKRTSIAIPKELKARLDEIAKIMRGMSANAIGVTCIESILEMADATGTREVPTIVRMIDEARARYPARLIDPASLNEANLSTAERTALAGGPPALQAMRELLERQQKQEAAGTTGHKPKPKHGAAKALIIRPALRVAIPFEPKDVEE